MHWLERLNASHSPLPQVGAVSLLHWAYAPHLTDNVPHRHTYYEICLVGRYGSGLWSVEGHQYPLRPGDLFLARPGALHQIQNLATPQMELFWVSFDVKTGNAADELTTLWRAFRDSDCVWTRDDGSLFALWNLLQMVAGSEEVAGRAAQLDSLQRALLLSIAQTGAGNSAPPSNAPRGDRHATARLAARYLQDNLSRKISMDEVASHVHLSPRHLSRLFVEFTGVSLASYLETARLDRARHLLRGSKRPIKEIAASVGFDDVHYFTRLFSKRNGLPPAKFRAADGNVVRIIQNSGDLV